MNYSMKNNKAELLAAIQDTSTLKERQTFLISALFLVAAIGFSF